MGRSTLCNIIFLVLFATLIHDCASYRDEVPLLGSALQVNEEPSATDFMANMAHVDFSQQPFAEQMVFEGNLPMTDDQKVFQAAYWDHLIHEATEKLRSSAEAQGKNVSETLAAVARMPNMTEAVLYPTARWSGEFVPKLQEALATLTGASLEAEADMAALLERCDGQFKKDMAASRSTFYMGFTDVVSVKWSGPPSQVAVPLSSARVMHALDQQTARDKTDKRSQVVAQFFEKMYQVGIAKQAWSLEEAMDTQQMEEAKAAKEQLSSVTPYLAFLLRDSDKGGPAHVLMEGNGRINAMNMAMDKVRLTHPDFVEPTFIVQLYDIKDDFEGAAKVRKNRDFFLDLNWRTQFPDVEVPGWKHITEGCVRSVSHSFADTVKQRPRYFGYFPDHEGLYNGP